MCAVRDFVTSHTHSRHTGREAEDAAGARDTEDARAGGAVPGRAQGVEGPAATQEAGASSSSLSSPQ